MTCNKHTFLFAVSISAASSFFLAGIARADELPAIMVGEWCGETQKHGYSWRNTTRQDGTFSTYFTPLNEDSELQSPVLLSGRWTVTDEQFIEFIMREQVGDKPETFLFPPTVFPYQIVLLNSETRELYDPDWDTTFVSGRCKEIIGS